MAAVVLGALLRRRSLRLAGPRGVRCLQGQAVELKELDEDDDGAACSRQGATRRESSSVHAAVAALKRTASRMKSREFKHEQQTRNAKPLATPISTAMALVQRLEDPKDAALARGLAIRPDWTPDAEGSGLTSEELSRARTCLVQLHESVERECATSAETQTAFQQTRRRAKALTRRLDRLLMSLREQGKYAEVEGIAFLWDDIFPQFASNTKHWAVICDHYAVALNKQQRFDQVIDKFFKNWLIAPVEGGEPAELSKHMILTPKIVEAIFLACGHKGDAENGAKLLEIVRERGVRLHKVSYFHLLNTLLKNEATANFDLVVEVCAEVVHELHDTIPLSIMPTVLKIAAQRGELDRVMPFYSHAPEAAMNSYTEFRFDICLQTLWKMRYIDEMLYVLQHILESDCASKEMKARVCKGLLRKSLEERKQDSKQQAMDATHGLLELMEAHQIATSNKTIPPMLTTMIEDEHIETLDGFLSLFRQYPHVMQWNSFTVCELIIIAVRLKQMKLVDELLVHALDQNIPIKYVALEGVIAYYYRNGLLEGYEKASDIIQALRLNKHIPLGIAVTEIGMNCNIKLERYEHAINLFEDFSKMDGERKRVLWRKPILQGAMEAYSKLKRYDEANAMRQLLNLHHGNLLAPTGDSVDNEMHGERGSSEPFEADEDLRVQTKGSTPACVR